MEEQFEYKEEDIQAENVHQEIQQTPPVGLDRNRKIAVVVLVILAFFMLITWSRNLDYKLNDPFTYKGDDTETVATNEAEDSVAALRAKDTDGDKLSDWDELNVYNTSPYLEDSDSDGFSDFEEVMSDNDPTCAEGVDCGEVDDILNETAEGATSVISNDSLNQINANSSGITTVSSENIGAIREAFLEAGYDEDELNKMSDDEVYQLYLSVYEQYQNEQNGSSAIKSTDDAKAIRAAYIEAGYSREDIDKISDEDLVRAYKEAINVYENNQ